MMMRVQGSQIVLSSFLAFAKLVLVLTVPEKSRPTASDIVGLTLDETGEGSRTAAGQVLRSMSPAVRVVDPVHC